MFRRSLEHLVGLVAAAWVLSLRLRVVESEALARCGDRARAFGFWHGQQFALLRWARGRKLAALVSRSQDGALVASALTKLGIAVARGSSSRGGASGLRALVRALRGGFETAFALDGPKGPARRVRTDHGRAGVAVAATLSGGIVVPLASAAASKIVFRSWDRFELPLPFSRVVVVLGAPLEPHQATPEAIALAVDRASVAAVDALLQVKRGHHPELARVGGPADAARRM